MTAGIGPVAAGMSLASPVKRGGMTIPALDGVTKPVFEDLDVINMLSLQRSPDDDALHGFGHVEPGARTRGVQECNALFMAPPHEIAAVMACQIIQNEQHAQGRVHPIQLRGLGKRVPILPPSSFWDLFCNGWTRLENGGQFLLEPGMQDGIRTLIDRLGSQLSSRRSQQRQQFAGLATNVLVVLACWLPLWLKGGTGMRNGLIGTRLIFTPQRQSQALCSHIGSFNHRLFFLRRGIFTLVDYAILALLESSASMTPRSGLLPTVSGFVQRMQDGKRADLGQAIGSGTQSTS